MTRDSRREPTAGGSSGAVGSAFARATGRTLARVVRQCSRTGCAERATVTLTYEYARAQVWLDHLADERDPHSYDLCDRHGARQTVPQGWHLRDRRSERVDTTLLAG